MSAVLAVYAQTGLLPAPAGGPAPADPATGLPVLPAAELAAAFGAAADGLADARLLSLPVRSVRHTFAHVTSPGPLADALAALGLPPFDGPPPGPASALVTPVCPCVAAGRLALEEYAFAAEPSGPLAALAAMLADRLLPAGPAHATDRASFAARLVVVADDALAHLAAHARPRLARRRADAGGPTHDDLLPPQTLLYAAAPADWAGRPPDYVVVGHGRSVGLGICAVRLAGGADA